MARGAFLLVGTLAFFNLALGTIAFAFKYNRFPSGLNELFGWMF